MIRHQNGMAPTNDFVTYIHPSKPILLRRHGWETADDIHEHFYDLISHDNGQTWTRYELPEIDPDDPASQLIATESSAVYVPQRDRLIIIRNRHHQPPRQANQGFQAGFKSELALAVSTPENRAQAIPFISDFGLPMGLTVSFSHPLLNHAGQILLPIQTMSLNTDNQLGELGYSINPASDVAMDHRRVGLVTGSFVDDDTIQWRLAGMVPFDPGLSSRGLCEGTLIERADRRLVMVMRGSNHLWPDKLPGYKWVSHSDDAGRTWSQAKPLGCDSGLPIESSSTGSLLFRSPHSHQLYWLGNLCVDGSRARGNWPRSPLVIARVNEDPFALVRSSITVLDQSAENEHPNTQHSNFQLYMDRQTGHAVFYLTRYGQRGYENSKWLQADHYCYRVALD